MESTSNFWLLWLIYLAASAVFFVMFWRLTRFPHAQWLSYLLRATLIALALTPWYANQQSSVLAPALMILTLDLITIGGSAAVRSLVPLTLALVLAWSIGGIAYLFVNVLKGKRSRKQKDKGLSSSKSL